MNRRLVIASVVGGYLLSGVFTACVLLAGDRRESPQQQPCQYPDRPGIQSQFSQHEPTDIQFEWERLAASRQSHVQQQTTPVQQQHVSRNRQRPIAGKPRTQSRTQSQSQSQY